MVARKVLQTRLNALENYLAKLRAFQSYSKREFLKNDALHDLAERYLHLLAECVIDIGNHLVSDRNLGAPGSYREVFQILEEANYIESELSTKLQDWTGYRNILVHGYMEIDHEVAFEIIKDDLREIEQFKTIIQSLI